LSTYESCTLYIYFSAFHLNATAQPADCYYMAMLVHTAKYTTPLHEFGIDKPFALDRGALVLAELQKHLDPALRAVEPQPITRADALLVHTQQYVDSLEQAEVWKEIFELKPHEYSPEKATRPLNELFHDIALKSGGTSLAAELALENGMAANLGGGYHHAFSDRGRGFCVLHDVAIAIRKLQRDNKIERAMIVDVDFHQGDGSALIFRDDPSVFTLSIHSEEGWPEEKQQSDLDIPVYSHEQGQYLDKLRTGVKQALGEFSPQLVMFVAGSDAYELDVLPGTSFLQLKLDVMRARDEFVLQTFADLGVPLCMVFAGGYGPHVWEVHYWATRRLVELARTAPKYMAIR
jgi:acetoin utilization deacetylase AcuC-like enzyme